MDLHKLYELYLNHPEISKDTRNITPGCLYWAIKGDNFDGNAFVAEAFEKGAAAAIVDNAIYAINEKCFVVENSIEALQQLATHHRKQLKIPIIAITGSNGKTTTKELTQRVLSKKYKTFATPGNLNNHIGLPLSLLQLTREHEIAIIELGANHLNENAFLCEICRPDFGLITNIGKDHLEGFGGMDGVEKGNMELFDFLLENNGIAFVNADDERILRNIDGLKHFLYSTYMQNADFYGRVIENFPLLKAEITNSKSGESLRVNSQLFGSFNLYNLLAAAAIGFHFNVEADKITDALESYTPQNNRSQIIKWKGNIVILDAYNANPSSMSAGIASFANYPALNKVLLLGDMFELGDDSEKEHEAILQSITYANFETVALAGDAFYKFGNKFPAQFFKTTEQLKQWLSAQHFEDTTFYVKGSRGMKMETVFDMKM